MKKQIEKIETYIIKKEMEMIDHIQEEIFFWIRCYEN